MDDAKRCPEDEALLKLVRCPDGSLLPFTRQLWIDQFGYDPEPWHVSAARELKHTALTFGALALGAFTIFLVLVLSFHLFGLDPATW